MACPNIIDVKWILDEVTGRLRFEGLRVVACNPKQVILVEGNSDTVGDDLLRRYERIVEDRQARRIRDD